MKEAGMLVGNFELNSQKQESYSQWCLKQFRFIKVHRDDTFCQSTVFKALLRLLNETVQLHSICQFLL